MDRENEREKTATRTIYKMNAFISNDNDNETNYRFVCIVCSLFKLKTDSKCNFTKCINNKNENAVRIECNNQNENAVLDFSGWYQIILDTNIRIFSLLFYNKPDAKQQFVGIIKCNIFLSPTEKKPKEIRIKYDSRLFICYFIFKFPAPDTIIIMII